MRVILNQDVSNLGAVGQIVNVRNGYARNFLIPRGLAALADEKNKAELAHRLRVLERRRGKLLEAAKKLASQIEKTSITIAKQVGEDEKIFGTVTTSELEEMLRAEGLDVSRKDIKLSEDVKKVGVYSASIRVHPEVEAKFKVWVVAQ